MPTMVNMLRPGNADTEVVRLRVRRPAGAQSDTVSMEVIEAVRALEVARAAGPAPVRMPAVDKKRQQDISQRVEEAVKRRVKQVTHQQTPDWEAVAADLACAVVREVEQVYAQMRQAAAVPAAGVHSLPASNLGQLPTIGSWPGVASSALPTQLAQQALPSAPVTMAAAASAAESGMRGAASRVGSPPQPPMLASSPSPDPPPSTPPGYPPVVRSSPAASLPNRVPMPAKEDDEVSQESV